MKNAVKKWYNYLFILLGVGILIGVGLAVFYLVGEPNWPLKYSWYFMIFAGVFCSLVGFIIQDLYRGWKRHKMHDWDNPLPDDIINKAWSILFPLLTTGVLTFLVGLIAYLITK